MPNAGDVIRASDLGDEEWTAVALESGITTLATLQRRERFGLVEFSGKVVITAGVSAGASKTIALGQPIARDSFDLAGIAYDGTHKLVSVSLNNIGSLIVYAPAALGANVQITFSHSFEIDA